MQDYAIKYKCTYPNSCPPVSQLQTLYNSGSIMHVISFQQKSRNGLKTLQLEITWKRINQTSYVKLASILQFL